MSQLDKEVYLLSKSTILLPFEALFVLYEGHLLTHYENGTISISYIWPRISKDVGCVVRIKVLS